jgi:hypothetical protein
VRILPLLVCLLANTSTGAEPAAEPSWVLGSDSPRAGEISDAWLLLPAALGGGAGLVRSEVLVPAGLEAWIRREDESCQAAHSHPTPHWEGRVFSDVIVPVCLRASRAQKLRILARVHLPEGAPVPAVRVVAADVIEVQPRFHSGEALLAVLSALLGFLAGAISHWIEKRGEAKAARIKAESEMEAVVAKGLSAEILRNQNQLRDFLADPGAQPAPLATPGGALVFARSGGVFAYLNQPERRDFLGKFKNLYSLFGYYNSAVDRRSEREAREFAEKALKLLDSSLLEFTGGPPQGGAP